MNRIKVADRDGKAAVLIVKQRRPKYGLHGSWLRSPLESKLWALRQGFTLTGSRQR